MKNLTNYFLLLVFFLLTNTLFSQEAAKPIFDINLEFQAYPTGLMPGIRFEKGFGWKNAVSLRLGYNVVRHGNAGVKDDETGGGFGFSLGYKRYLKSDYQKWFLGIRNDIWFNKVDWIDNLGTADESKGTAEIMVVQPTIEAGYLFQFGKDLIFSPTLAFGYEINVKEDGGDVGEGAIMLIGLNLGKRF